MLEDQVASLLQRYLGNYVRGLSKEALKISVWRGDVELSNMQLKPEALNALRLPVKVKAGFLGSIKLKVPWSRLGQEPVLVYLDRILILAEPEMQVEGFTEEAIQEAKAARVREMEMRLLEDQQHLKSEINSSWLGSFINTIIGNLKLSITNVHIRYEDLESNPGHPFAAGLMLGRLSAMTVDDAGNEAFATGGALERIQKSVELERLAFYLDSNTSPWNVSKQWEDLHPSEWSQIFELENNHSSSTSVSRDHCYILQPVTGNARYTKVRVEDCRSSGQPLQKAAVNLEDVTLCLSQDGYKNILGLADNFTAFNQRLKYAHYRPQTSIKVHPKSWWKYAYRVVTNEVKSASGMLSWEQVLKHARLRKKYISLYASLLKSDASRMVIDDNEEIKKLDRELDIDVILQWRMLAHKFVQQSLESDVSEQRKQKSNQSWWTFGWSISSKEGEEFKGFTQDDWERLNKFIGYKEGDEQMAITQEKGNFLHFHLEVHMKHNASKLISRDCEYLADLSCDGLDCTVKIYPEAKVFDLRLGSYMLSSPNGLLAESATVTDSLVGTFSYKPFESELDWSFVAKASPCYMTYLKDSIDGILSFFRSSSSISQTLALETAAALQMTLDGVKRTAQQQVSRALKDHARFLLDLDIAAPKITVPTEFCPDNVHATKLLLDFGNLKLSTEDKNILYSEGKDLNLQFNMVLNDVSAFLVDGEYSWRDSRTHMTSSSGSLNYNTMLPVIDKCGVVLKLQQVQLENPFHQSTEVAVHLPSFGFHFSPARYHRLVKILKLFLDDQNQSSSTDVFHPWQQADFEGWLFVLSWKGVGNREAVWQHRYVCIVGAFFYILENPSSKAYKQCFSLRGKQIHNVPLELTGGQEHVLAVCDSNQFNAKVIEDVNALILRCETDDSRRTWQNRLQGTIYRASASAAISGLSDVSSTQGIMKAKQMDERNTISSMEKLFVTGILDELKICFSCNYHSNQNFNMLLLGNEGGLFEFRASGGQVELSVRENDLFIGTILKSLEIEDLFFCEGISKPQYLARSFIKKNADSTFSSPLFSSDVGGHKYSNSEQSQLDAEDSFFEASDNLSDFVDSDFQSQGDAPSYSSAMVSFPSSSSIGSPSFSRVPGLLPDLKSKNEMDLGNPEILDSFVKAQIIFLDQDSPFYNNVDKKVSLSLATLTFFCHRPTVLAIMEFVNAINAEDDNKDTFLDTISADEATSSDVAMNQSKSVLSQDSQEPVIKGLLGRGKSRVLFSVLLNMTTAQIFLMNEDGICLATLSQNNLQTEIKVFPSSFKIKASLGNLRISDNSLPLEHPYFWVCDMRNPVGSSFVKLEFNSFSIDDEDYEGYDYSLNGQLSEVRIIYLNRFIQEVVSYFVGLAPNNSRGLIKLKDKVTNSEMWFTSSEIEGSPAVKLDISLNKPIILMPRITSSLDYLELDVLEIAVCNTFQWFGGDKNEINAIHIETMIIKVKDINLTIGTGTIIGESIIQDVKGISIVVQRSLRDLLHQIPSMEATIEVEELTAALSNREYQIITECTLSNFSETPQLLPPLNTDFNSSVDKEVEAKDLPASEATVETMESVPWVAMKITVILSLVKLNLYSGSARDSCLATMQANGAWLLYKSNSLGQGFLSSTLKHFTVIDNRESTMKEFRLAVGEHGSPHSGFCYDADDKNNSVERRAEMDTDLGSVPTMLILDVKIKQELTTVSLCIQKPHLLVALDFLLSVVEFFVPTVRSTLSDKRIGDTTHLCDAIILEQSVYYQPSSEFSLSPEKPLIVDSERFDHFIYDGKGGTLYLQDRHGVVLSNHSDEAIIFIGNGKRLHFRNVIIKNGEFLDSSIYLGANSGYSASEDDNVFLGKMDEEFSLQTPRRTISKIDESKGLINRPQIDYVIDLQVIGPELTFYSTSRDVGDSLIMSTKLLHAQFDMLCRLVMKEDTIDLSGHVLGLKLESNGIRVLEPFDTYLRFSNISGITKINASISDIYMNFSFSILKLFLTIQEDILEFLRMTTNKVFVVCSQFDRVGTIQNYQTGQTYAFWRPRSPPGFAVLGDCLTPLNEPPSTGVTAVNISFAKVKRPLSFKLVCPCVATEDPITLQNEVGMNNYSMSTSFSGDKSRKEKSCSIWFPVAPEGYVAVGCVVSNGSHEPPLSSALCLSSSLVSCCSLKDCISLHLSELHPSSIALWRVDNSFGSFLPTEPCSMNLMGKAYELRNFSFTNSTTLAKSSLVSNVQSNSQLHEHAPRLESSALLSSNQLFKPIASFRLIWWNQGTQPNKRLSLWRPVVPQGMAYLGDIAVHGYEPPNTCVVLHDMGDDVLLKPAIGFQLVGYIKKQKGTETISFWLPQAPPGFVSLGCIASKGTPKQVDFGSLRCVRSDLVTGSIFSEESIWSSSDSRMRDLFSIWTVDNEACTFFARKGIKKPPKRFALRLADPRASGGSDDTIIDLDMNTFSASVYDDYAGLMVPLFNIFLGKVGFNVHSRVGYLTSTVSFSLAARSYNDKLDSWEPLIESVDGRVRYEYNLHAPDAISQLRIATTKDLNLIISVSNMNMIIQAYSSWNSLNNNSTYGDGAIISPPYEGDSIIDVHHRRSSYIIPQNKLGQDVYIRVPENKRSANIIKMPSGDNKCVTVPISKNLMNFHLKGKSKKVYQSSLSIIIAEAELPGAKGIITDQYVVTVRIFSSASDDLSLQQQGARTCGAVSKHCSSSRLGAVVIWNETFFFKVKRADSYMVEFTVVNVGTDEHIGVFLAPLKTVALMIHPDLNSCNPSSSFQWQELLPANNTMGSRSDTGLKSSGRIRFCVLLTSRVKMENDGLGSGRSHGLVQISPTKGGPWTTVRLNYAAPAACWRFGNTVIVSEVNVLDGNRYVNIRSLVSLINKTGMLLAISLKLKPSVGETRATDIREEEEQCLTPSVVCETDELFETEKYVVPIGWVGCSAQMPFCNEISGLSTEGNSQDTSTSMLPDGWEWTDDWHIDTSSINSDDGWIYAPGPEHLKWPESFDPSKSPMHARQRRWIRHRKCISSDLHNYMSLGLVKPGESVSFPLQCSIHPTLSYYLMLRPEGTNDLIHYSWSKALSKFERIESNVPEHFSDVCVSNLTESEELLFCSPTLGDYSNSIQDLWFRLNIKASDIGKDIHADSIHDWTLVIDSPLSLTNFLPLTTDYSFLHKEPNGEFITCSRGSLSPGETVKVHNFDLKQALYLSLVPRGGWEPLHEPALISHPKGMLSTTISLRSCFSGRIVRIILEQSHEGSPLLSRLIRIFVPYWITSARCPPLIYRIVDVSERRERTRLVSHSGQQNEKGLLQITQDEMLEGHTMSVALNFKHSGMSLSLGRPGKEHFGPIKELFPLQDMDGSVDIYAYDTEGNCFRVLVSSKPCHYQGVPTKVISVRPFMTFTNRVGRDIFIKFGVEDQEKVLHPSDSRVSFMHSVTDGSEKLLIRMEDTNWSFPVEILKEDKITLMLRNSDGERKFVKLEIRGYEEGSKFLIVLRPGSAHGPIRFENRIPNLTIHIRQSSLGDDAWISVLPLSSINFSWEIPYGPNLLDVMHGHNMYAQNISLEKATESCANLSTQGFEFHVLDVGDVKIARITNIRKDIKLQSNEHHCLSIANRENLSIYEETGNEASPMEIIVELSVVSFSLIDHRPRELLYLYLEKVFISYATGYDGGTTSRLKLIIGQLQLDNQLPLSVMPVLLMPERMGDTCHPVIKTTITMTNGNTDGIQVYPYIYVRVTENYWRINIHEPIIWALIDFYSNLHIDNVPNTSSVTQVDPEIRIDLIDVSEIRLKVSLETAPTQRPHGVLGMWSPIISAVGNAFKIQVRLRKVMHRSRFMRKSFIIPAIMNRIKRDLIHNPLHIILSVDVLGMTKSTFASLSKGFAELSTDVQFLQLRSKQVWSRRITGVSDGILQGTEALAQGVAFGVSGVITKPVESARQRGVLGLPHGLGRAILGFIVQPVSGALDFVSLTADGIGASCARFLELLSNKSAPQRIRNPRAFHINCLVKEYSEREATGQMILYLAEASRHLGCTNLFKEPSKYAWSDSYEDHFILPHQRILLITNRRVLLLLCLAPDKMDKKPSKIIWDVPWEEVMALELAKAGYPKPSHLIIHIKNFKKSESFVRLVKCNVEEDDDQEPQAVRICLVVRQTWKAHQSGMKSVTLLVPERRRYVQFAWDETDEGDSDFRSKPITRPRELPSSDNNPDDVRFVKHIMNFQKIWSSERDSGNRCIFCPKQVVDDNMIYSIWRPICPDGYVPVGDVARVGIHPPHVAAIYRHSDRQFAHPVGYDLVWRNCIEDYATPVSIWSPRPPEGFVSLGCVAVAGFEEPHPDTAYCVSTNIAEEAPFEEQLTWTSPDSYPWACFVYQVHSEALHFVAMRLPKEDSNWKPMRVLEGEREQPPEDPDQRKHVVLDHEPEKSGKAQDSNQG